ncbi:hypothetical protein ES703_52779 [subsurface metagenome]
MKSYDLSKEQSVLGNLLSDDAKETIPKIVKIFGNLGKSVFYHENNRLIYHAILQLYKQARPTHPKFVVLYLREKLKADIPGVYLFELLAKHDLGAGLTEECAKDVKNLAVRRKIEELGSQITQKIKDGIETPRLIEEIKEELSGLKKESTQEKKGMTALESLNARTIENAAPIEGGILVRGRYCIIGAADGEGKTTLCLQLALCAITKTTFLGRFPIEKSTKEKRTETYKPNIVIFDPLNNFISGDESLNNDTIARNTAIALNRLANEFSCFPILTTHLKKETDFKPANIMEMFHGSRYWTNPAASQIAMVRADQKKYAAAKKLHFNCKTITNISPMLILRDKDNLWYEEISLAEISKAKLIPKDIIKILNRKFEGNAVPSIFQEVAAKELGCTKRQIRGLVKVAEEKGLIVEKEGLLHTVEFTKRKERKLIPRKDDK